MLGFAFGMPPLPTPSESCSSSKGKGGGGGGGKKDEEELRSRRKLPQRQLQNAPFGSSKTGSISPAAGSALRSPSAPGGVIICHLTFSDVLEAAQRGCQMGGVQVIKWLLLLGGHQTGSGSVPGAVGLLRLPDYSSPSPEHWPCWRRLMGVGVQQCPELSARVCSLQLQFPPERHGAWRWECMAGSPINGQIEEVWLFVLCTKLLFRVFSTTEVGKVVGSGSERKNPGLGQCCQCFLLKKILVVSNDLTL